MRKILCMLCGLTMTAALFAEIETASLENTLTSGVFDNEFDTQFTPNADFGSYGQHFIYGGLGNPGAGKAAGEEASKDVDSTTKKPGISGLQAFGTKMFNEESPMMFGYYMPGKLPMSFFASFGGSAITIGRPKSTTKTEWKDESRTKKVSVTKTGYYTQPLFEKSDFKFQYLIGIGTGWNLVSGLQFEYNRENDKGSLSSWTDWKNLYSKVTHTNYSNPADSYTEYKKGLTGTSAPSIVDASSLLNNLRLKGDETVTSSTDNFTFRVPVAFSTGSLNHVAALKIGTKLTNKGGAYYRKQDSREHSYKSSIVTLRSTLGASYSIEIPAADRDGDSWSVGTDVTLGFNTTSNRWTYSYTKPGVNAFGKYAQTHKPSLDFAFKVEGSRMLKFASPKQSLRFNLKPTASFEVATGLAGATKDDVTYRTTGYDANITASGTVNGTKVTHRKITKGEKADEIVTAFTSTASVPMGLKILPEGWKVGFLLGATPEVSYRVVTKYSGTDRYKSPEITEKNTINGSDVPGSGYTNKAKYPSNTAEVDNERTFHWNFKEKHTIGLTVPFEGGAHLDVRVNGSLLTIEGFAIQAFIPLGSGKAAAADE